MTEKSLKTQAKIVSTSIIVNNVTNHFIWGDSTARVLFEIVYGHPNQRFLEYLDS